MDGTAMALHDAERGGGVGRGQHDVALRLEGAPAERKDGGFVFDNQQSLAAACRSAFLWTRGWVDGRRNARQVDLEAGAPSRLGIHGDVAAALFHDAVHRREPES